MFVVLGSAILASRIAIEMAETIAAVNWWGASRCARTYFE